MEAFQGGLCCVFEYYTSGAGRQLPIDPAKKTTEHERYARESVPTTMTNTRKPITDGLNVDTSARNTGGYTQHDGK